MSTRRDRKIARAAVTLGLGRGGRRALRRRWFEMGHDLRPRFSATMDAAWAGNRTERARCYLLIRGVVGDDARKRLDEEFGIRRIKGPRHGATALVGVDRAVE